MSRSPSSPPPTPGVVTTHAAPPTPGTPDTPNSPAPKHCWNPPGSAESAAAHLRALHPPPPRSPLPVLRSVVSVDASASLASGHYEVGESSCSGSLRAPLLPVPALGRRLRSIICAPQRLQVRRRCPAFNPSSALRVSSSLTPSQSPRLPRGLCIRRGATTWTRPQLPRNGTRSFRDAGGVHRPYRLRHTAVMAASLEAQRRRAAFLRRFKGCYSRCLAPHRRAADCRNPVRCADCWGFGHRARDPICKGRPKTPHPAPTAACRHPVPSRHHLHAPSSTTT